MKLKKYMLITYNFLMSNFLKKLGMFTTHYLFVKKTTPTVSPKL